MERYYWMEKSMKNLFGSLSIKIKYIHSTVWAHRKCYKHHVDNKNYIQTIIYTIIIIICYIADYTSQFLSLHLVIKSSFFSLSL